MKRRSGKKQKRPRCQEAARPRKRLNRKSAKLKQPPSSAAQPAPQPSKTAAVRKHDHSSCQAPKVLADDSAGGYAIIATAARK